MNTTFLDSVVDYYYNTRLFSQRDWSRYTFVFTSHRAGSYFKHALKRRVEVGGGFIFGLNICTIDELFSKKSQYVVADNLTLTFMLYEAYKEVLMEKALVSAEDRMMQFDFFYSWSQTFIGDFDDIDKYLADPAKLFDNVFEYEALSDDLSHIDEEQREVIEQFWNVVFKEGEDGKMYREQFLMLYGCLHEIYSRFRERLASQGLAYNGMLYKDVVERFVPDASDENAMHYVFIGFNALTSAERVIFNRLTKAGLADFFWDYSAEIIKPMTDEKGRAPRKVQVLGNVLLQQPEGYGAGRFVTIYKDEYPAPKDYKLPEKVDKLDVKVTSVAYSQSQVACVEKWLGKLAGEGRQLSDSALVLGDESMLLSVLQSLPDEVDKVNITMGYPIKYTSVYSLLELLACLDATSGTLRSSLVLPIIQHPTLTAVLADECNELRKQIVESNYIYIKTAKISGKLAKFLVVPSRVEEVPSYLVAVTKELCGCMSDGDVNLIDKEATKRLHAIATRFAELMKPDMLQQVNSVRLLFSMFNSLAGGESIDFRGDKYDGLQIMGMMETRCLDFENICVLSLNEGEFPKSSTVNTFIPRTLRYSYALPTQEFRDSIFAYYFFRLISRADSLDLVYHSNSEGGEPSRFLLQMQYQYGLWDGAELVGSRPLTLVSSQDIEVLKSDAVMKRLYRRFDGGETPGRRGKRVLSPSAITEYKTCSLRFYFSYVVGLHQQDGLEEEASAAAIGNIFHKVMQMLYDPNKYNHIYTEEDKRLLLKDRQRIVDLVDSCFREEMNIEPNEPLHGRNILYRRAIEDYVLSLVEKDMVDITFLQPEKRYELRYQLDGERTVWLGGVVDRMHLDDKSRLWIVDYKTGKVNGRYFRDLSVLRSRFVDNKVLFQTLLYTYFVYTEDKEYSKKSVVPGVIVVRDLQKSGDLEISFGKGTQQKHDMLVLAGDEDPLCIEFKDFLKEVVTEIFDKDKPFRSAEKDSYCGYCPYLSLCSMYKARDEK
ncbi:MAG: PD-(D/E)XK nuclease family protein [Bacteroidia bacterium]|nr:PD-(D/E)XK nuclease family protein [Bacteroidia bacterium]